MKTSSFPLISCLCVTHNRVSLLKRAIRCFKAQTYPNKELIVTYKNTDNATRDFLQKNNSKEIVGYELIDDPSLALGDIRNKAIAHCNGAYFCNWDDDDWYHSDRLLKQFKGMYDMGQTASLLTNILIYDEQERKAYFSVFRFWEMSILCKKSNIDDTIRYASLDRSEDALLVMGLLDSSGIFPEIDPNLIIYVVHGKNTLNRPHFSKMFRLSQELSPEKSKIIEEILSNKISVTEGSRIISAPSFLEEQNFFHRKAGYLTLSGITIREEKKINA